MFPAHSEIAVVKPSLFAQYRGNILLSRTLPKVWFYDSNPFPALSEEISKGQQQRRILDRKID